MVSVNYWVPTSLYIGESQQVSKVNSNWFLSVIHTQKIRSV